MSNYRRVVDNIEMLPLGLRVRDACKFIGVGRTKLFQMIKDQELTKVKIGKITVVTRESLVAAFDRARDPKP